MFKLTGRRPRHLGIDKGHFSPLPGRPSGVSSQADAADAVHYVPPLRFDGDGKAAMKRLAALIDDLPRAEIVESKATYLYAEFSGAFLGLIDDVEFYYDGKVIHVRAAARLGYSDFGSNRKRIEAIRRTFS